jgi:hypothetical protein
MTLKAVAVLSGDQNVSGVVYFTEDAASGAVSRMLFE